MKRFSEMAALSIGIAAISFGIGFLMRQVFGIDIEKYQIQVLS
jgi:hypothetical protein